MTEKILAHLLVEYPPKLSVSSLGLAPALSFPALENGEAGRAFGQTTAQVY